MTAGQADITSMLCNLLKQQSAPDVGLDVSDGNPLQYHNFMTLFHELVEKQIDDPRSRLTRLIRYTKGDPKDMIQHCVPQPPSIGYKNAKKILDQKYGNPYNIMGVYRKEIKSWPQIRNGDGESYQKFYNFLLKCESIIQAREWNPLDTPDVICMLLSKLPGVIRDKWVRVVMNVRRKKEREATLRDFIGFIKEETDLVNDPLFSKGAIDQYQEKKSTKNEHPKKRLSSYAVKYKKDQKDDQQGKEICLVCGKDHLIDHCKEFMEKSPKERTKILTKAKLCFGCYQPMTENHNAKS